MSIIYIGGNIAGHTRHILKENFTDVTIRNTVRQTYVKGLLQSYVSCTGYLPIQYLHISPNSFLIRHRMVYSPGIINLVAEIALHVFETKWQTRIICFIAR
jgi:hypothetical protein